jgi:hypothetical protein
VIIDLTISPVSLCSPSIGLRVASVANSRIFFEILLDGELSVAYNTHLTKLNMNLQQSIINYQSQRGPHGRRLTTGRQV